MLTLFKCTYTHDNGVNAKTVCSPVFLETTANGSHLTKAIIKEKLQAILTERFCDSNDSTISDLTFISLTPHDGLVL